MTKVLDGLSLGGYRNKRPRESGGEGTVVACEGGNDLGELCLVPPAAESSKQRADA